MSIPSADSRSELCGTDTHRPRCVGCNRDLFLSVFELDFRLPFTPSGRLSGPSHYVTSNGLMGMRSQDKFDRETTGEVTHS